MRKGQQKQIDMAIKHGFSDKKITYLKREDKPVTAYSSLRHFIGHYSDDELGDFFIVDELYEMLATRIDFLLYPNVPSISRLKEILESRYPDELKKQMLLMTADCNFSMEHMKELCQLYPDRQKHCDLFRNYIRLKHIEEKWELFLTYAGTEKIPDKFLQYAIDHDIPFEKANEYGFSFSGIPEYRYELRFSYLALFVSIEENQQKKVNLIPDEEKLKIHAEPLIMLSDSDTTINNYHNETLLIRRSGLFLNISLCSYKSVLCRRNKDNVISVDPCNFLQQIKLVCFPDNRWYREINSKRYPLTIRMLSIISENFPLFMEMIRKPLMEQVIQKKEYAVKDILDAIYRPDPHKLSKHPNLIPGIPVSEAYGKPDLNNLFHAHYVDGKEYNWNRKNISTGYLFMKALKKTEPKDRNILKNFISKYHDNAEVMFCANEQELLKLVLLNRLNMDKTDTEDKDRILISDYIDMSYILHKKIRLSFRSIRKIEEMHNELTIIYAKKRVGKIEIPKNSRFNELEKKLPRNEFIRIKSSKAIKQEGDFMHHCVATYWEKVNNDQCAIFHLTRNKNPYTVEFVYSHNRFVINQIQARCDRSRPQEVWEYVKGLVDIINEERCMIRA